MDISRGTALRVGRHVGVFERAMDTVQEKLTEAQRFRALAEAELLRSLLEVLGSEVAVLASTVACAAGGDFICRLMEIADLIAGNPPEVLEAEIIRTKRARASVAVTRTDGGIDVGVIVVGYDPEVSDAATSVFQCLLGSGINARFSHRI